ncbi:hypothetical protein D3C87_1179710 [compost metagenome]
MEAVSRSMITEVCRPLSLVSVSTSSIPLMFEIAARTLGSQVRSVSRSSDCKVNWYCELLWRPPTRMSCTDCR